MLKRVAAMLCGVVLVGWSLVGMNLKAGAADVPYVTGGVGADSREELQAKESEYNLKIVVAATSGDYLADVKIVIDSARNERVLDATMEGPILLARLAPGTYTVRATSDAQTQTKTVTIAAQGLRLLDFRWPRAVK
jgi:hypothetical protein